MSEFIFRSSWVIEGAPAPLFDALHAYTTWPEWWPGAERMTELASARPDGTGGRGSYRWRSPIGYRIEFEGSATRVERPQWLAGTVEGDLRGSGTWQLSELADGTTRLDYLWQVTAERRALRVLAPIVGPILRSQHDRLMRAGAVGLAQRVGQRLVSS